MTDNAEDWLANAADELVEGLSGDVFEDELMDFSDAIIRLAKHYAALRDRAAVFDGDVPTQENAS